MNCELMLTYDTLAKCAEKYLGTDGRTNRGKTVYPPPPPLQWSGSITIKSKYLNLVQKKFIISAF
jgi:hypothetical protein